MQDLRAGGLSNDAPRDFYYCLGRALRFIDGADTCEPMHGQKSRSTRKAAERVCGQGMVRLG